MNESLNIERQRYQLSETESETIFREDVVPWLFEGKPSYDLPAAVFLGGQQGIGKTSAREAATVQFGDPADFVVLNMDELREFHPAYSRLRAADDRFAYQLIQDDPGIWRRKAIDHAIQHGYSVIVDSTMQNPEAVARMARLFRDGGYVTAAAFVAGHESRSRLQILDRYLKMRVHSEGRYVSRADHDHAYAGVLASAALIDQEQIFDHVAVFEASGGPMIYRNALGEDGNWIAPADTVAAIGKVRDRRRPLSEVTEFYRTLRGFLRRELPDGRPALEPAAWSAELADIASSMPHSPRAPSRQTPSNELDEYLRLAFEQASRRTDVIGRAVQGTFADATIHVGSTSRHLGLGPARRGFAPVTVPVLPGPQLRRLSLHAHHRQRAATAAAR